MTINKSNRGGARPGSGPKPRTDGRTLRPVKVALTDEEFKFIKDLLDTDDRRIALMDVVKRMRREMQAKEKNDSAE